MNQPQPFIQRKSIVLAFLIVDEHECRDDKVFKSIVLWASRQIQTHANST